MAQPEVFKHSTPAELYDRYANLFYLLRAMETSLTMIDKTYGHLVSDSDEYVRGLLDAYDGSAAKEGTGMTTETVNYRRERLTRGWLDLYLDTQVGGWRLAWTPDFGEPDWPGHMYSPEDDDLPSDYPDPTDSDALVEWGQRHFGP